MLKLIKKFLCKIGWHSFTYDLVEVQNDPLNTGICNKYKCNKCHKMTLYDNKGNCIYCSGKGKELINRYFGK